MVNSLHLVRLCAYGCTKTMAPRRTNKDELLLLLLLLASLLVRSIWRAINHKGGRGGGESEQARTLPIFPGAANFHDSSYPQNFPRPRRSELIISSFYAGKVPGICRIVLSWSVRSMRSTPPPSTVMRPHKPSLSYCLTCLRCRWRRFLQRA